MICPKCGKGNLHINYVQQYAMRHKLGKDGRVLKEVIWVLKIGLF